MNKIMNIFAAFLGLVVPTLMVILFAMPAMSAGMLEHRGTDLSAKSIGTPFHGVNAWTYRDAVGVEKKIALVDLRAAGVNPYDATEVAAYLGVDGFRKQVGGGFGPGRDAFGLDGIRGTADDTSGDPDTF